jgi:hypothetical protein
VAFAGRRRRGRVPLRPSPEPPMSRATSKPVQPEPASS